MSVKEEPMLQEDGREKECCSAAISAWTWLDVKAGGFLGREIILTLLWATSHKDV